MTMNDLFEDAYWDYSGNVWAWEKIEINWLDIQ
jgi:hypothetical protein